jgi:phospholipid-translocating ATPase
MYNDSITSLQSFVNDRSNSIIEDVPWRYADINESNFIIDTKRFKFKNNSIRTTKYTLLNFFPKNLVFQFTKLANFYFLLMAILQVLPPITITNSNPTILVPLIFVVLLSMIKDALEDYKRKSSDDKENNN